MEQAGVRSLVWYPDVLAAGLVGGFVGNLSTALLFAVIGEALFYFLSLCFTALVAALCAVLAGNALAGDGRRARLWSVVGVCEVAGVLAALANLAFVYAVGDGGGLSSRSRPSDDAQHDHDLPGLRPGGLGPSPSVHRRSARRREKRRAFDRAGLAPGGLGGDHRRHVGSRRLMVRRGAYPAGPFRKVGPFGFCHPDNGYV
jgi:hypothetical protein